MSAVVVANRSFGDATEIARALGDQHNVTVTTCASDLSGVLEGCDLLIMDANLSEAGSMDVLMEVASARHLPILMVVPPNDPQYAMEAVRNGAYNYVVKVADYLKLLPHAVKDALAHFYERAELQRTITGLKTRIAELEARLDGAKPAAPVAAARPQPNVMAEILAMMREGEINLPAYPKAAAELRRLVHSEAPLAAIVRLLEKDVAIATKLLGVANSAYYRGAKDHRTLAEAIGRLGLTQTCNIVELLANRSLYSIQMPSLQPFLPGLWTHAVASANAAQLAARHLQLVDPDAAFIMGLLHDIGKLVLLQIIGEIQLRGSLQSVDPATAMAVAREHHCKFGAEILKRWKLPAAIAQVALRHENIFEAEAITRDLLVVNFADTLANFLGYGRTETVTRDPRNVESTRLLKLTPDAITEIEIDLRKIMTGYDFSI